MDEYQDFNNEITVELLALDLESCTRCVDTNKNIETALEKVKTITDLTENNIKIVKTLIQSEEDALNHRFASSPTIRINNKDIVLEDLESECESCTDLCDSEDEISCRSWIYKGKEYNEAPVGLIIEKLMSHIYGNKHQEVDPESDYQGVPENLKNFFLSKDKNQDEQVSSCCSTEEQQVCCEPNEKSECCGTDRGTTCGCK